MRTMLTFFPKIVLCTGVLFATVTTNAQNPNLGTSGAQFLQIPVGGKAAAMAGAYISNVNDASAIFWNPSGIVHVNSNDVFFAHTEWWASIQLNHAAFVHSTDEFGSFGVSMSVLSMDKMEVTTELEPEGTGQFFDAQDVMIGVSSAQVDGGFQCRNYCEVCGSTNLE